MRSLAAGTASMCGAHVRRGRGGERSVPEGRRYVSFFSEPNLPPFSDLSPTPLLSEPPTPLLPDLSHALRCPSSHDNSPPPLPLPTPSQLTDGEHHDRPPLQRPPLRAHRRLQGLARSKIIAPHPFTVPVLFTNDRCVKLISLSRTHCIVSACPQTPEVVRLAYTPLKALTDSSPCSLAYVYHHSSASKRAYGRRWTCLRSPPSTARVSRSS